MEYNIRYGELKGQTVSKAFKDGKYIELMDLRKFLLDSFLTQNEQVREIILNGILTIDYYFSLDYSNKISEFYNRYIQLPKEKKFKLDKSKLEDNDLLEMVNYLNKIKQIQKN